MKDARDTQQPTGEFTTVNGEDYYRISGYHRMPPFLMSLASDTDLWMFITSQGGLTAGRVDAEGGLFPYETVDRLHDGHHHTGPITLIRVERSGRPEVLWQPFCERSGDDSQIERNLYKNTIGNRLIFEETHHGLDLTFRYRWSGSDVFGLVRTATLMNRGSDSVKIELMDGLRNILPCGAPLSLHQHSSSLIDAYKRTDCDPESRLGIFSLTSKIIDRPEAAEQLRANTVWSSGLEEFDVFLSIEALAAFRRGEASRPENTLTGQRGNYFVRSSLTLDPGGRTKWHLAADVGQSHIQLAAIRARLLENGDVDREIEKSLLDASENLIRNVASADGLQLTAHTEAAVHHFANVLFNNMRGGIFTKNYDIPTPDLVDFLQARNRMVVDRNTAILEALAAEISLSNLLSVAESGGDTNLQRLCYEYLPIYFGRRHGDPSRPWNRFTIHIRNPDGSRALRYEGNWRDIFQNWEALSLSFPGFLPSIISKFVNASTVDGFNPYRITRDGIDWEVVDPDDPWSHIGYWGDHQIIYLLKFLEALSRFTPGKLESLLELEIFCYADLPYRIKPYQDILKDPNTTILYDTECASQIEARVEAIGADGKLVHGADGSVYHVNLLEKLLVPALSKLSNLVPDGGIWMNTQRPEWNDANNALVGNGLSVVTLCYLRRYLHFLELLLAGRGDGASLISTEVVDWLRRLVETLDGKRSLLDSEVLEDPDRKQLLDALGSAFSQYRTEVYSGGFSGKKELPVQEIVALCRIALEYLDHAIRANRREDGLYHSYNLLELTSDGRGASILRLYEMLEGQVAALSSGLIDASEAVRLLSNLFESRMYRKDQHSFLLYRERELPAFLEKNVVPPERIRAVPLLRELLEELEPSILLRDLLGDHRFHGDFRNADDLATALDRLAEQEQWREAVSRDRQAVLEIFEEVFNHRSFTGRSGTMYGYEGLGCIYWHMVSKLLLAVQENLVRAAAEGQPTAVQRDLTKAYYRVRRGLSFEKSVLEYGAFPTDPYSHTTPHAGAQQPGMTGQVKEEFLTRFGELGVGVEGGMVTFRPVLLRRDEFLKEKDTYQFYDLEGRLQSIDVPAGALAFSFCQVPIIYELSNAEAGIRVTTIDGRSSAGPGDRLDREHSRALFERLGNISRIDVSVPEDSMSRI
jgi:hypothetical protein